MTDTAPIHTPSSAAEALALAKTYCDRVSRAHDAAIQAMCCPDLPARSLEASHPTTVDALPETRTHALALASVLNRWRPQPHRHCACRNLQTVMVKPMGHMWRDLGGNLSALIAAIDANTWPGERPTWKDSRPLHHVEERVRKLTGWALVARSVAEVGTDRINQVFRRATEAGCVHIPKPVTDARIPADLGALHRALSDALQIREEIAENTYLEPFSAGRMPGTCCEALPPAICMSLLIPLQEWVNVLHLGLLYAVNGTYANPAADTSMYAALRRLDLGAEDLLKQF